MTPWHRVRAPRERFRYGRTMPERTIRPYGSWPTPITSEVVVAHAVSPAQVSVDGGAVIWSEGRPAEAGRTALVRRDPEGSLTELLPEALNARTAVHEYGGGSWWVRDGVVWFANWSDQRLYRRDPATGDCEPLTPEPELPRGDRYADGAVAADGSWIACVREHHPPDGRGAIDVRNEIVRLDANRPSVPEVLVSGPDFVSTPRFSRDGTRLCWLEWDHPNMPWDGTRLMVRNLVSGETTLVAGGGEEVGDRPQWRPDGSLTFISDRNGWWNLYRHSPHGEVEPLIEIEAEIGTPQWVFGVSRYEFLDDGRIVFARWRGGFDGLAVRLADGEVRDLELPFTMVRNLAAAGGSAVVVIAGSPRAEASVTQVELTRGGGAPDRRRYGRAAICLSWASIRSTSPCHRRSTSPRRVGGSRTRSSTRRPILTASPEKASCRRSWFTFTAVRPRRRALSSAWRCST